MTTINLNQIGKDSKEASRLFGVASTQAKNAFLHALARSLGDKKEAILVANSKDLRLAKEKGLSGALLDRLSLQNRLEEIIKDVLHVEELPDPVGEIFETRVLPNGLKLAKHRTPLGVLGVIYEARPNVTVDITSLALKTGNAVILRGGSETLNTNTLLVQIIQQTLEQSDLPPNAVQLIASPDRSYVQEMVKMDRYIDMLIPRGGTALQEYCKMNSTIPVITGGVGICHLYLDEEVDLEAALPVIFNAKVQRPAACNALDTLLVHEKIASKAIPKVIEKLQTAGVEFHLDPTALKLAANNANCIPAKDADWDTEWLSLSLGIKVVSEMKTALHHIAEHSMSHSDGILTSNKEHAKQFVAGVDSACVYVNASTRFTDGGQFGLGAEVAVTTQKLHARGPMGLKELTTYKWVIEGEYHVRS